MLLQQNFLAINLKVLGSMFFSLLNGGTFERNVHLWDEQKRGAVVMTVCPILCAKQLYLLFWSGIVNYGEIRH